ncbi:MAG: helix-turn-helix domain-containing protein [Desulfovibrio sp.]|jgi:hypothetical protein|nr:helix-turn-helix domain-containing protein [Desulfovibrio sp. OttesenSCG-928-G15]MDR2574720.1 helix-turn-helix domain-containing protein [Desulfovibrio sp.]
MNTEDRSIIVATPQELRHLLRDVVRAELAAVSPVKEIKDVMNEKQAAEYIGQKPGTLRQWRTNAKGPAYHKKGRRVFYKKKDLDAWMAAGRRFTTETPDAPL